VKIQIDRIAETPQVFPFEATPAWWRGLEGVDEELAPALREDARVTVTAYRLGADLCLEAEVDGAFELTCGRCLTRYRHPIRERARLVLEPAGSRVPADPEGAASLARDGLVVSEELETGWFRGQEIRLDRFVQEVIALVFPVQPLCREDCRGLCPQCGIDRNTDTCDCREAPVASPFAVLESLRGRPR